MEFKGTKGEWGISEYSNVAAVIITTLDTNVCNVFKGGTAEAEANAKLIAAAPELLESLLELLVEVKNLELSHGRSVNEWLSGEIDKAEQAIKKALE